MSPSIRGEKYGAPPPLAPGPTRTARDAVLAAFGTHGVAIVGSDLVDALACAIDAGRAESAEEIARLVRKIAELEAWGDMAAPVLQQAIDAKKEADVLLATARAARDVVVLSAALLSGFERLGLGGVSPTLAAAIAAYEAAKAEAEAEASGVRERAARAKGEGGK